MSKENHNYVLIGIMIVIIPVLLCLGAFFLYNIKNKPENKWNDYINLLKEAKYEEMYEMIDDESKSKISLENFVSRNKNIYEGIEAKNIKMTIQKVEKESLGAKITYKTEMDTVAGNLEFTNSVTINRGLKDGYKIKWSSNLIFPELNDNEKVRVTTLKATRGSIVDRNGQVLANDSFVSSVGIVPGRLGENKTSSINKISEVLNVSVDSINKALSAEYVKDDIFVPIKDIPYGSELTSELLNIPGVSIQDKDSRVYPNGKETAHLVGYIQTITADELTANEGKEYTANSVIGKAGLEKMFEDTLRGIDGVKIYIEDESGKNKLDLVSKEAKNGQGITLTIDLNLQKLLYEQLKNDNGCSVAMNPDNGEILALVSTPSYDNNDFIGGMSTDEWNTLNNDINKPLYNRFQSTVAPGSSFKPITAAIALETNKLNPNEDKKINGLSWQKDSTWGNYNVTRVHTYGEANLKNALVYSDNIYFAMVALDIGSDIFTEELKKFGFEDKIPCDYALYNSQISTDGTFKNAIQLADSGYGQGEILVNPIHLTSMYTMFLNSGNMLKPKLLVNDNSEKIWKSNLINKENSNMILEDLKAVVSEPGGTGHAAYSSSLSIAGKTGTAEIKKSQDDTEGTETGWFVAMTTNKAPNNLLVSMMIEDVKDRGGSSYVVPKVKQALDTVK